jgi:hypothetical protein
MQDGEISIMEALNQIQSWINSGQVEKAIQGCEEILKIEPGNQRAIGLLKKANSQRFEEEKAAQEAASDPLADLKVETVEKVEPETEPIDQPELPEETIPDKKPEVQDQAEMDYSVYQPPRPSAKKMFLAMAIPAVMVVVIGGGIVTVINNANIDDLQNGNDKEEIEFVEDHDHSNDPVKDTSYLAENEQRVTDLTEMADAIDEFWWDNKYYPSLEEVDALLESELESVPTDPNQGEEDVDGDPYGYMYAAFDMNEEGQVGAYILSAIFQDSKGNAHAWAQGASTKNYDDFRDIDADNVIYIGN